ncbi:MAG TPA: DUF177 domain-containing protein, partial [Nitrospirae bacterium]|nr:DUF177 domain-containing protein [Nitrospirota bacterium]
FKSPIIGFVKIFKTNSQVIIEGVIKSTLELNCSRCLNDYQFTTNSVINTVFHPASVLTKDDNYELHTGELDTEFYKNDEIDLIEFLIQEIRLNIPMKPLCKDDCKGLCPNCGVDLNSETCDCNKEAQVSIFNLNIR